MCSFSATGINIRYEVKDLVRTIDFYNILLAEWAADLYPKHAVYEIKDSALTLTFIENPSTDRPVCGNFNLFLKSDEQIYDRFQNFTKNNFSRNIKIDPANFIPRHHAFSINDPNGLTWGIESEQKKKEPFKLFNIPRINSMWNTLKPI